MTNMKKTETITLFMLFLFSPVIQGEDDLNSPTRLQNLSTPSTSSSPRRSSTAKPESLSRPTLLNGSSEGDLSVNDTRSQTYNVSANGTVAPGVPAGTAGPTANTYVPGTAVLVNSTDAQDESDHSVGNNQTSTLSSTFIITATPRPGPVTTSLAPPLSQNLSTSTGTQITTSLSAITTQRRGDATTVSTKDTVSASSTRAIITTTTTISTTTTQIRDTAELNVGDDPEYTATAMDPLLVGLVSVFVVTAAVVSLLIFLKFRRRNERPEFRRLQDLPMDDMMEDTPLSMYSY